MKKVISMILLVGMVMVVVACAGSKVDYSGTYLGYSWKDEAKGVSLEDAKEKIETTLVLDSKGIITDAKMLFYILKDDGNWIIRQDTEAKVEVDFSVTPTKATLESDNQDYLPGASMFSIQTADKMAFYAVAVNDDGTTAFLIVEPFTRYQYEFKMANDFDYSTKIKDMTIGNGLVVPTIRTSGAGYIKPESWDEYADYNVLSFYQDSYVITGRGVFEGLTEDSSIKEYLERTGVIFEGQVPSKMEVKYGFSGIGGWKGNYKAIGKFLIGKDAKKVTSLIDWDNDRYKAGINEDNFFGLDDISGATKTVQDSYDGIAGASVRLSRESNSYQRALVEAGIIEESDVIKGRF